MARATRLELMHDHVAVIYRAVTGGDLPEPKPEAEPPSIDQVERHFAELEAMMRSLPRLAERVAPFSFRPQLDVIGTERELVIELAVPGVERGDVHVHLHGDELSIQGARSTQQPDNGQIYLHAEIARGPFRRVVRLPEPTTGSPRLEVENGIIRVRLARATKLPRPRA